MSEELNEEVLPDEEAEKNGENANESKADKFKRIATYRTNNALKILRSLGQLSAPAYEYTPEQVEKIFGAIQKALDEAKEKFNKTKPKEEEFTL